MSTITLRPDPSIAGAQTARIQTAIDEVRDAGGGKVVLESGTFLTGTLRLYSHINLHLEQGAILKASDKPKDFIDCENAGGLYGVSQGAFIIEAMDCEHISITGLGCIHGNGLAYMDGWRSPEGEYIRKHKEWRPRGIGFTSCKHVTLKDFTFRESASWTIHFTGCEDVLAQGLHILNRLDIGNCDGIDPDHCRNVRILGCHIEAADDCIVLKNTIEHTDKGPCENIVISNCTLISTSAAIKLGTESSGDFRNILVDNCIIQRSHRGLAIQLRDDGVIENVSFTNCIVETRRFHPLYWGRGEPIYVTAVPRNDGDKAGTIRNIRFFNIRCRSEGGVFIQGTEDAPIENLSMESVAVEMINRSRWEGGHHDLRPTHGDEHGGLEEHKIHGVFIKHARDVYMRRIRTRWIDERPDFAGTPLETIHAQKLKLVECPGLQDAEAWEDFEGEIRG